jgi:prevent-host-death family protein
MAIRVGMHEAKTNFSRLVAQAEAGEEIVVQRSGTDVARIVAVPAPRRFEDSLGIWKGRVDMSDDFDELPEDIAAAFGMSD